MTDDEYVTVEEIMPPDENREHEDWPDCWCGMALVYTTADGGEVWTHHAMDGSGPPPDIVMSAIAELSAYERDAD